MEKEEREKIIERKVAIARMPESIVIAPKVRECHFMIKILFGFDRAVNKLRMHAGLHIPVAEVAAQMKRINGVIEQFNAVAKSLGDDNYSGFSVRGMSMPDATKEALARKFSTYVFVPRTEEAKTVTNYIRMIDSGLLQLKTTCTDFSKTDKLFRSVISLIREFHTLCEEISKSTNIEYRPPKGLKSLLGDGGQTK